MFRILRAWPVMLLGLLLLSACNGGSETILPPGSDGFDIRITTDKTGGPAPLTVSFFVTPAGGTAPYTYSWDFNDDGIEDANAPSGQFIYENSAIARVSVTDARGITENGSVTITITTEDDDDDREVRPLTVRFNATPMIGRVPFDVRFSPVVSGGRGPYTYAWDFEGDGRYDEFTVAPLHRYEEIGQLVSEDNYAFFPVLQVTDSRGVIETNLQDIDGTPGPDGLVQITTLTNAQNFFAVAFANPQAGQAPLTVEFTASVGGGSNDITYVWDFGDNTQSNPSSSSLITHTYNNPGTYLATVTAHDNDTGLSATSAQLTVTATEAQPFELSISADINSGQVPFVVNFQTEVENGQEPIQYSWSVFDNDPANPNPGPGNPPTLSSAAVVTPSATQRKDPAIHFANTSNSAGTHEYRVRCAAVDALGTERVSEWVVITALPHTQPAPRGGGAYTAKRALVVDEIIHPASLDPTLTAQATFVGDFLPAAPDPAAQDMTDFFPQAWTPRANAAVVSHPTGVTFIIGGEQLSANGTFQGLVSHGDANYAYVPTAVESHSGTDQFGKYGATLGGSTQNGGLVRLNDGGNLAPAFPVTCTPAMGPHGPCAGGCAAWTPVRGIGHIDTVVPSWVECEQPPAQGPPSPTSRSTLFNIVGSAAAVLVHEPPESNEDSRYPPPLTLVQPGTRDVCLNGLGYYPWPDCPATGWNIDNPMLGAGLGSPVIYVIGGRTGATTALDTVQKYYPYGFGNEDIMPMSINFRIQATGNQADIWSTYFYRPDRDQFPGSGSNFDPQIEPRTPGGNVPELPTLPVPLYGLMAVRIETGVDFPQPTFPQSGYSYAFVMGGIEGENGGSGAVSKKMYYWNTAIGVEDGEDPGSEGLWSELPDMPEPRAYGQATLISDLPLRIAVTGGFDSSNQPINSVFIYTFADNFNPVQGTWSEFNGSLEEALRSTAVGWHPGVGGDDYVLSFGGYAETDFTYNLYSYRLGSGATVTEALPVVPRGYHRAGQGGAAVIGGLTFNRYTLIGGVTEQGTQNIIEVVSLP